MRLAFLGLLGSLVAAWCQTPVISRMVNSASYQPTLGTTGSIVSVFGTDLATTTAEATVVPLPITLGGTSVTVGGNPAPLFYVSPTQINFQTLGYLTSDLDVVVTTSAGSSSPYNAFAATPDAWYAAGIFSADASGCGQGAVLDVAADGSLSVNSSMNSSSPGDWISIYGTGITGFSTNGAAAPSNPPIKDVISQGIVFDLADSTSAVPAAWTGLAPGYVGLDQLNVQIPAFVREGCAVPIQVAYANMGGVEAITPPLTIAVRAGGGACVDPPPAGYGQITWQKTVATSLTDVVSETDMLTAFLQASPGQQAPPLPVYIDGCPGGTCTTSLPQSQTLFGPACPVPGYRSLGAGNVTVQGTGLSSTPVPSLPFIQGQLGGLTAYQASLPPGTIREGSFTLAASGGADIGAFQATLPIGADIDIQNPLNAYIVWNSCTPLTISWTGGDPNSWVTVSLVPVEPAVYGGFLSGLAWRTRTTSGSLTIPPPVPPANACGLPPPTQIEIDVEVDPDPSEIITFTASGLSLGGRATWRYLHTFQAWWELE